MPLHNLSKVQQTLSGVDGVERVGKDERQHSHQLHDNVQSRSRSIFERISNSVTDNSGLVDVRSLALQLTIRGSLLIRRRMIGEQELLT